MNRRITENKKFKALYVISISLLIVCIIRNFWHHRCCEHGQFHVRRQPCGSVPPVLCSRTFELGCCPWLQTPDMAPTE